MNENEYGGVTFNRTDDGKKELRISDKDNIVFTLKKIGNEPDVDRDTEKIDQITVIDDYGNVKRVILADHNKPQKKTTSGSIVFAVCVVAFIAAIAIFLLVCPK